MSKENKVKFTVKDDFRISLFDKYIADERNVINVDSEESLALIKVTISRHGQGMNGYVDGGRIHVNGDAFGYDGMLPIPMDFVDLEKGIEPLGVPYIKGRLYKLADNDDKIGMFAGVEFDQKSMEPVYIIQDLALNQSKGKVLVQLNETELDARFLPEHSEYYKDQS